MGCLRVNRKCLKVINNNPYVTNAVYLSKTLAEIAPVDFMFDYGGQSRQFEKEGAALMMTFVLALIVIYLVLSAQFESFRDPFVVLITVPLSIFGAMIPLFLGFATMNIYTQVGLITLIGLISKHGILIVEFSNQLQRKGMDKVSAVKQAAALRLRPILMTTPFNSYCCAMLLFQVSRCNFQAPPSYFQIAMPLP